MKFRLNPFRRKEEKFYVMDRDKSPVFNNEEDANKYSESGNFKVVKEEE